MSFFVDVAVIALCIAIIVMAKLAYEYLESRLSADEAAELDKMIADLVSAAEQMYKSKDDDGSRRLGYVQGMLMEAGYKLTDAIRAKIESKVFEINKNQKKGDA